LALPGRRGQQQRQTESGRPARAVHSRLTFLILFSLSFCPCLFFSPPPSVPSNGNLRTCGWDKETLVATANEWSAHIGLREVPTIEAKTIGKVRRGMTSSDSARAGGGTCTAALTQRASDRWGWCPLPSPLQPGTSSSGAGLPFCVRHSFLIPVFALICFPRARRCCLLLLFLVQMGLKGTRGLRIGQSQQGGGGRGGGGRGGGQQQGGGGRGGYGAGGQGRGGYGGGQGRPQSARY